MYIRNRVLSLLYKLTMLAVCGYALFTATGFLTSSFNPMVFYSFSVLSNLVFFIFCFISIITVIVKMAGSGVNGGDGFSASLKGISLTTLALSSLGFFLLLAPGITARSAFGSEILFANTAYELILPGGTVSQFMFLLVPIMAFIDWLLFTRKGKFLISDSLIWLLAPMSYFLVAVISGTLRANYSSAVIYPYSFLNVATLGWAQVFINASVFLLITFVLGCLLILLDRLLNLFVKDKQSTDENHETPPPNGGGKKNDVKVAYVNHPEEDKLPLQPTPAAPAPETPPQNSVPRATQENYYTPQQTPHFSAHKRNSKYNTGALDNTVFENRAFTEPLVSKTAANSASQVFKILAPEPPMQNEYQPPPQAAPLDNISQQNINYENSRASRYITGSFSAIPASTLYSSRTTPNPAPTRPQDINVIEPQYLAPQTTSSFAALRNELPDPKKATAAHNYATIPPQSPYHVPPNETIPYQDSPLYRTKPFPAFSEASPQQFVQLTPPPRHTSGFDTKVPDEANPHRETVQEHFAHQGQIAAPAQDTYTPNKSYVNEQPLTAPLGNIYPSTANSNTQNAKTTEQEYFRNTVNIPGTNKSSEHAMAEPAVLHWRSNLPASNMQAAPTSAETYTAQHYYGQPEAQDNTNTNPYTGAPRHTAQLPVVTKRTSPGIYSVAMPHGHTAPVVAAYPEQTAAYPEQTATYTGAFRAPTAPYKTASYAVDELSDHNKLQYPVGFSADENT